MNDNGGISEPVTEVVMVQMVIVIAVMVGMSVVVVTVWIMMVDSGDGDGSGDHDTCGTVVHVYGLVSPTHKTKVVMNHTAM